MVSVIIVNKMADISVLRKSHGARIDVDISTKFSVESLHLQKYACFKAKVHGVLARSLANKTDQ